MHATSTARERKGGLAYWANRVLEECDKAAVDFAPDPVHDLRVAIRRCRSMADGFLALDPDPAWKQMKKLGKTLFSALGDLRDTQVMLEWVARLAPADDPLGQVLTRSLREKESAQKTGAQRVLQDFDRKRWSSLNAHLAHRTGKVPLEGPAFQHLALQRWTDAHALHRQALRNRSQRGYHRLRIGIKRFRYTLENFLPAIHARWAADLRELQDALGEIHDLDVLRALVRTHPEIAGEARAAWQEKIAGERQQRLDLYRSKMVGRSSLWIAWRAELPAGAALEGAAMATLRTWASFLDPDNKRSAQVAGVALRLFDGLRHQGLLAGGEHDRRILEAAAFLREVGRGKGGAGHHKRSYRMILKLTPPLGWTTDDLRAVAWVVRYHRGALPQARQASFGDFSAGRRAQLLPLAGILRLASTLGFSARHLPPATLLERRNGNLVIYGPEMEALSPAAERLSRARYLLEVACGVPILIQPVPAGRRAAAPSRRSVLVKTAATAS